MPSHIHTIRKDQQQQTQENLEAFAPILPPPALIHEKTLSHTFCIQDCEVMNIENGGGVGINCLGFYGNNGKMNARSLLRLLQLVSTFHCDMNQLGVTGQQSELRPVSFSPIFRKSIEFDSESKIPRGNLFCRFHNTAAAAFIVAVAAESTTTQLKRQKIQIPDKFRASHTLTRQTQPVKFPTVTCFFLLFDATLFPK
ncbi:hypothetical protein F2P81_017570 [Scophthalmus maximus]|uniref:Uncharacterized protein n=1 Tax=Scophthalmus maximus TaxID=52904 RepID=A0A6A4SEA2_SCOMX|nr:hypothetical protein F2P81_017570 [Scophthalmus maximus]